jgi:hypothetical protein
VESVRRAANAISRRATIDRAWKQQSHQAGRTRNCPILLSHCPTVWLFFRPEIIIDKTIPRRTQGGQRLNEMGGQGDHLWEVATL